MVRCVKCVIESARPSYLPSYHIGSGHDSAARVPEELVRGTDLEVYRQYVARSHLEMWLAKTFQVVAWIQWGW